jgi:SNF2 family DNA or RNA helicase
MIALTGGGFGMPFDDPGTGKTITAILGLREIKATWMPQLATPQAPVICVVPPSTVTPWVRAWNEWAPGLHTVAWRGPNRRQHYGQAGVYVVSYDTARNDAGDDTKARSPLVWLRPAAVVCDELHWCKNPTAGRTWAVRRIARHARIFIPMSGTPITHTSRDLHPTLLTQDRGAWPSGERYAERYLSSVTRAYGVADAIGLNPAYEPEFRLSLLGTTRRIAKADAMPHLPPKVYSVRQVKLPPQWRKIYDDLEADMLAELDSGQHLTAMHELALLTRLRQLSSAPADVETTTVIDPTTGEPTEHVKVTLRAPSWKVSALLEILDERQHLSTVVFADSRQLIMLAGAAVAEKFGRPVGYIVGDQTPRQRQEAIDTFQAGGTQVLVATTQAGGVGITLTAASTVVFLQRPWSLVDSIQAEDRCHRIGSEKHDSIEIIDIVAANTIDARVRSVLRNKAGHLANLVQDPRIVRELLGGDDRVRRG